MGGEVSVADLRGQLLALERAAQAAPSGAKAANLDLDVARAHLLGRFDCILVLGRPGEASGVVQVCADEFDSSARYVIHALGHGMRPPAAAEAFLCKQP
jgi:hypothetical protein